MTDQLAQAAAIALALVFNAASLGKARRMDDTRAAFAALRVPVPAVAAFVVPLVELVLAVALLLVPAPAAWVALGLLAAFTAFLARAVATGTRAPCACFGARRTEPVSAVELLRNAMLAALAVVATGAPGPGWPGLPALVIVTVAVALGRVVLALVDLRRSGSRLWPGVPQS